MRCPLLAFSLAAALLSSGAHAGEIRSPSDASAAASAAVVLVPLSVVVTGSYVVSTLTQELSMRARWRVKQVRPQDQNTTVQLRSEDGVLTLDMQVPTATARANALREGDALDLEPVGKAGFMVKKGAATIGVLSEPGAGMIHSTARG
jgi:hypothetical protein